eukprot:125885_1
MMTIELKTIFLQSVPSSYHIVSVLSSLLVICIATFLWRISATKITDLPGPKHYPFFGSVFEFYRHRKDFAHWMISNHRKYGKNGLWYLSAPGKTEIHVTEPKLIAYVFDQGDPPLDNINPTNRSSMDLLFHENNITLLKGDAWRARRRLTMNMFSPRLMKECVLPATEAVALELHKQIDKFADSGEFLDLQELCVRAMMESTLMLLVGKVNRSRVEENSDTESAVAEPTPMSFPAMRELVVADMLSKLSEESPPKKTKSIEARVMNASYKAIEKMLHDHKTDGEFDMMTT